MKSPLLISAILAICICIAAFAFCYGYFRGYHDRSRVLTAFYLGINEANYTQLVQSRFDILRMNLESSIYMGSQSYKKLEAYPFRHVVDEITFSRDGDISELLKKAEEITKGISFPESPPTFEGITRDTKKTGEQDAAANP